MVLCIYMCICVCVCIYLYINQIIYCVLASESGFSGSTMGPWIFTWVEYMMKVIIFFVLDHKTVSITFLLKITA